MDKKEEKKTAVTEEPEEEVKKPIDKFFGKYLKRFIVNFHRSYRAQKESCFARKSFK